MSKWYYSKNRGVVPRSCHKTWKQLAETSVEKSQEILVAAGERYKIHNPST